MKLWPAQHLRQHRGERLRARFVDGRYGDPQSVRRRLHAERFAAAHQPAMPDSSQAAVLALARHGWLVRGGEAFGVQAPAQGLRITVSTIDEAGAQAFAGVLAQVLGRP